MFNLDNVEYEPSSKCNINGLLVTNIQLFCFIIGCGLLFIGLPISLIKRYKIQKLKKLLNKKYEKEQNEKTENEIKNITEKEKRIKVIIVLKIIIFLVLSFVVWVIGICKSFSAKPIIYLYPETNQEIIVKLGRPENITCSYPKYKNSWRVKASPNGDLIDIETGRSLYALYWEGKNINKSKIEEGFCVKGEDSVEFLEEKLEILGLTPREAEEFIVYWLPKLEKNKYNLIRFETVEEIENNMPLEIYPKPDSVIRVMMEFKGSNKYVNLKEQKLVTPQREGFVVVEWGGTEL